MTEDSVIDQLHAADVALSVEAGQMRDHPVIAAAGAASEIADQPPAFTLAAIALGAGLLSRRPRLAEGGGRALAALWLATRTKSAIKSVVVRTRPYKLLEEGHYETGVNGPDSHPYNSFPSGHTADAFAAARAIGRVAPGAKGPLLGLAALIGLVQVPRATHHLADVIAGAAVGIAAEAVVHHALQALPDDRVRAGRRALIRRRGASENDA
ncbi:phosphatase PAP2 family protein [Paracoccus sphaerophysae]|uniref:phosphatase PAP2 family protein n=1 Tax=Paracoccus sphaerophysae TaxID=690417 RepID=UPI00068ED0A4|nr:phosphatase PAP2 family protein [Paracoccus sphaerophysae]